ncbi:MAG TPA: hypothetical protein VHO06_05455, partial [Polyangia bacterium]|nr:hypothetical protein [Polyangia bacterium]
MGPISSDFHHGMPKTPTLLAWLGASALIATLGCAQSETTTETGSGGASATGGSTGKGGTTGTGGA